MRVNVDDFRRTARRRLPRAVFDFVDSGAGTEATARANEAAFERIRFRPRAMVDVSGRTQATTILGAEVRTPVLLGPAGGTRLVHREGELAVARAAARAGTVYALSTGSNSTIEEVADAAPGAVLWFQVYLWRSRELVGSMVARAKRAGFHALVLTVDTPTSARRDRDLRNGLLAPPKRPREQDGHAQLSVFPEVTMRSALDALRHPQWLVREYLTAPPITFKNVTADDLRHAATSWSGPGEIQKRMSETATWDEVSWLRRIWDGPLLVKGIVTPEDAVEAFRHGADGVIVSNHGGRHLDSLPATIEVLPQIVEVADAAGREVLIDGGVRRGIDVVKAVALGARGALIVRPYHWALAAEGEDGVARLLDLMSTEIDSALGSLGCRSLDELGPAAVDLSLLSSHA